MNPSQFDAYLHTLNPFAISFGQGYGIRWYGLAYLTGFVVGYYIILWLAQRKLALIPTAQVGDFVFNVAIATIVGGRLGYCIFYNPNLFLSFSTAFPFWGVLAVNQGGMASHGGILGIIVACCLFGRKNNIPVAHLCDLTTLGGAVGIFFGRIANFINGELVGRPITQQTWDAVKFPQDILLWPSNEAHRLDSLRDVVIHVGVSAETWSSWVASYLLNAQHWASIQNVLAKLVDSVQDHNLATCQALKPLLDARYPSQLYEALLEGALVFVVMLLIWRSPRKPGIITASFFILYATVRIIGEQFRLPDLHIGYQLFGLTRGQWLSLVMLGIGLIGILVLRKQNMPKVGGWGEKG